MKPAPRDSILQASAEIERALGNPDPRLSEGAVSSGDMDAILAALTRPDAPPRPINLPTLATILDRDLFQYRGVWYRVPKIPWPNGLALLLLQWEFDDAPNVLERADRIDPERLQVEGVARRELARMENLIGRILALFRELCEPVSIFDRWSSRWRKGNPFASMGLAEIVALMAFFSECRMKRPDLRQLQVAGAVTDLSGVLSTPRSG